MSPETQTVLLALLGAFLTAATNIAFTPPLARMGSFALAQVNNLGNVVLLGVIGLWEFNAAALSWEAFAWFAALGVLNYGINRWVFYSGMAAMGPSRHMTVVSLAPLPNLLLAVFLLGESPGPLILVGTALVVVGVIGVSYEPFEGKWFRQGIGLSLTSALFLAGSAFVRNRGMSHMDAPALLTAWAALLALPTGEALRPLLPKRFFAWGEGTRMLPLILLGVCLNAVQQVVLNLAMRGQISIAMPITSATPVFVLLLSALFLRKTERLNLRVVVGVLVAVSGMVAIGVGRHG